MKVFLCNIRSEGKKSIERFMTQEQIDRTNRKTNDLVRKVREVDA